MDDQMKMFEAGGIASQKDKASNAFSEMDEMLEKGISEEVKKQDGTTVSKTYIDPTSAAEDLLRMLRAGEITLEQAEKFLSEQKKSGNYAKGGFEAGGLNQEGGSIDPISGNEVPFGSLEEEVRDDIDAKLSEGEFVFPADVVRYIGLENLMKLRQKAKEGLGEMEAMGQMGNSDEATMDDESDFDDEVNRMIDEFDPNALEEEEEMAFAPGGYVPGQSGYIPQASPGIYPPPPMMSPKTRVPTGAQLLGTPTGTAVPAYTSRQYIGPTGDIITITVINGVPVQPIPEGYQPYTGQPITPQVQAPQVVQSPQDRGGDEKTRQEQEDERTDYYNELDRKNKLAQLNPEFAKVWSKDPQSKITPGMTIAETLAALAGAGGPIGGVVSAFGTEAAANKAYSEIAKEYGLDLDKYTTKHLGGLFSTVDEDSLVNDAMATKNIADSLSRTTGRTVDPKTLARTQLDMNNDGRVTKEDLVDPKTGQLTQAGKELFMEDEPVYDGPPAPTPTPPQTPAELDADSNDNSGGDFNFGRDEDRTQDDEDFLAKGGLLAPRVPRKPKAKQTTSTRGKGLARKK